MTIAERYSIQTGKSKKYNTNNAIDNYIAAKVEDRERSRIVLDSQAYNSMIDEASQAIEKQIANDLQGILKNFK